MSDSCASCSGRCCYSIVIRVTGIDLWRIARAQMLPAETIVRAEADPSEGPGAFRLRGTSHALFLAKSAAVPEACTFLMHLPGDVRRCGIYSDRPLVCAVYPMTIRDGSVDIRDDVSCAKSNWNFATLHYATWRRALARYAFEWSVYGAIVACWNASVGAERLGLEDYHRYVLSACDAASDLLAPPATTELIERWNDAGAPESELARRQTYFESLEAQIATALPR